MSGFLDRIKTDISLKRYLAEQGYQVDTKRYSPRALTDDTSGVKLEHNGHQVHIKRGEDGRWFYHDLDAPDDRGTIVDWMVRHESYSTEDLKRGGVLRERLAEVYRAHCGSVPGETPEPAAQREYRSPPRSADAAEKARAEWTQLDNRAYNAFLIHGRQLAPDTLKDVRFAGTFRTDQRRNAVFAYHLDGEMVATERRNRPMSDGRKVMFYTKGAAPGMWYSNTRSDDQTLTFTESPIDAMALHELGHRTGHGARVDAMRFAALRKGTPDHEIQRAIRAMPEGAQVAVATDPDADGEAYAQRVRALAEADGRTVHDLRGRHRDPNATLQQHKAQAQQKQARQPNDAEADRGTDAKAEPEAAAVQAAGSRGRRR